jgi:UDP-4-amino-4,6-dideoxy-N-acetyl-beta-L-altrosamine transaminase
MIPYGRQDISDQDIAAVVAVLRSDFLTQGPAVPRFEAAVAQRIGARHAVAVNSATSALHVACMALGLGPGDVLWTTPNTFVASANCARYCGADVDFVDIDPATWNMSVAALERKLERAARDGKLPKIVVPVHFSGAPTQQEPIWQLAQKYGFSVLEDASHSVGARYGAEAVGSGRYAHVTVFSFHPVKIITTAEGGMAVCNDADVARRMAMLRTHGITREPSEMEQPPTGPWYYEQIALGYNYRMTDLHAALGLSQLDRIDDFIERRNVLARRYDAALADLPIQRPFVRPEDRSAFHLYVIRLPQRAEAQHRRIFEALRARGVGVNLHYIPVHLQPYYRRLGFKPGDFPEAEAYGRQAITLPLYAALSESDQDRVVHELTAVLREELR